MQVQTLKYILYCILLIFLEVIFMVIQIKNIIFFILLRNQIFILKLRISPKRINIQIAWILITLILRIKIEWLVYFALIKMKSI